MEFWLVVGLIIGVVLVWAAISDRRARRYHRLRSHREMAHDVHEHVRDVRAANTGAHLDQDQSWMHRPGSTHREQRSPAGSIIARSGRDLETNELRHPVTRGAGPVALQVSAAYMRTRQLAARVPRSRGSSQGPPERRGWPVLPVTDPRRPSHR